MAYPSPHYLLAFGGPLWQGEEWSCSLRSTMNFAEGGGGTAEPLLDEVEPILRAFMGTGPIGSAAKLGWIKYNRIGSDGRYVFDYSNTRVLGTPVSGSAAPIAYPPQIALVATLETGATRGLAHRGRIFLPAPRYTLDDPAGAISASVAAGIAGQVATLISDLNAVQNYGVTSVFSNTREGATRPVTGVSVGRVLDTMRSRRAQIKEDRPATAAVAGL